MQLAQIRAVAGAAALSLPAGALDDEFDPDEHEAAMGAAFGDDYYAEDDADEGVGRFGATMGGTHTASAASPVVAWRADTRVLHTIAGDLKKPQFGDLDEELQELLTGA